MIVDDSASVRMALTEILDADPEIEVIATAGDPFHRRAAPAQGSARRHLPRHRDAADGWPHLPAQDHGAAADPGGDLLHHRASRDRTLFLEALEAGAVDIVPKPAVNTAHCAAGNGRAHPCRWRARRRSRLPGASPLRGSPAMTRCRAAAAARRPSQAHRRRGAAGWPCAAEPPLIDAAHRSAGLHRRLDRRHRGDPRGAGGADA